MSSQLVEGLSVFLPIDLYVCYYEEPADQLDLLIDIKQLTAYLLVTSAISLNKVHFCSVDSDAF